MKTTRKIGIVTALLVSFAFASKAQTNTGNGNAAASSSGKEWRISVGPETGIPTGNYSNAYGWFFGGSAQLDIPVYHDLYVTVNAGYDDLVAKKNIPNINVQVIPVKAGLKYFFWKDLVYVQGQAGVTFLGNKTDLNADKSAAFTYTPQVGVLLKLAPKNYLDLGFRWEQTNAFYDGGSHLSTLGLRVAYSFGL